MCLEEKFGPIERATLYMVRLPYLRPFETSFGVRAAKEGWLLRLDSDGVSGWGECAAYTVPDYTAETNVTVLHVIREFLLPAVLRASTLGEALAGFSKVRGHNMAKAVVENALLDLIARKRGIPLFKLLGGAERRIPSGISFGIRERMEDLLDEIGAALERRYHRIKVKIKRGHDVEVVRAVRERYPEIKLMVDANAAYTIEDADLLASLDRFNLMMIEQPLTEGDLYFHAQLQKRIKTPICLDESVENLLQAEAAIQMGACRIINIKQARVGGLLVAKAIQAYCLRNGAPVWSGGMLETGIGRAFNLHLQTLPGFTMPGDTSGTTRYFEEDLVDQQVVLDEEGMIGLPKGPGIGAGVLPDVLNRHLLATETLVP